MNCPKCNATFDAAQLTAPPRGTVAKAILTDWRTWVGAFVLMALSGLLAQLIGQPSAGTVGGGAMLGVIIATRMARMRVCPQCAATIAITPQG